jgi:hypothetical protein
MRPTALFALLLLAPSMADGAPKVFALTGDFVTGSMSVADVATRQVAKDVTAVNSDAVVRFHDGLLYVVNRGGADNIQIVDPARNYRTLRQFSVDNGSNPQDIVVVSATKAYVSRLASADLLVVNPADPDGLPRRTISLAAFADDDGLPEMARMEVVGPYLFVACERLTNFQPVNPSVVVVVSTEADTVVDVDPATPGTQGIELAARNPFTAFAVDPAGPPSTGGLLIGDAGAFGALDGGIERIDPVGLRSDGLVVSEVALGGDIADIAWPSSARAYAIAGDFDSQRLTEWNPQTGAVIDTLYTSSGFSLPDMELDGHGGLWVCKNPFPPSAADLPGLLVFDTGADTLLAGPLDTGLPPLALVAGDASAPSPAPQRLSLPAPWPNPAAAFARVRFDLPEAAAVQIEIFDPFGRRVRSLDPGALPGGPQGVSWDLRDQDGRLVPAGLYLVQVRAGGVTASTRLAVVH